METFVKWFVLLSLSLLFISISIVTILGIPIQTTSGEYQGYITSVEQNGIFFKGWNVYLKTDLTSSNEDVACIDRSNPGLINDLKEAVRNKTNLTLGYISEVAYSIVECPGDADFIIIGIKK